MSTYALNSYNLSSSLCWGNCFGHLELVCEGPWHNRIVHLLIALVEAIPILGQIISLFEQFVVEWCCPGSFPNGFRREFTALIRNAPDFNHYAITLPDGQRSVLTAMAVRPANLFFQAAGIPVTQPGSGQLFAITVDPNQVRQNLELNRAAGLVVDFAANGYNAGVYGNNHYRISYAEIVDTLDSQQIYLTPGIPLEFYRGLKAAMYEDRMVVVPGDRLRDVNPETATGRFLRGYPRLLNYTFYEIGTQVVKSEDYRIFIDERGKIFARQEGANDAIRLISMCGLRNLRAPVLSFRNQTLMYNTFRTSFTAAQNGIAIYPAVGMSVWGGDPELYWEAFFSAYLDSPEASHLEAVCVNSGHRPSPYGNYQGSTGQEFLRILERYKLDYAHDPIILAKLNKIIHLGTKDVVQLAHRLKLAYPNLTISLINASDPDVTLGNHVGEYVNNRPHISTTEENYTAMGTNGLCFESLTHVHNPAHDRIHALRWN